MTLTIDRLRLALPAPFRHRADGIARRVADELARRPFDRSVSLERLTVPGVNVRTDWSDARVASHVADAIHARVHETSGD